MALNNGREKCAQESQASTVQQDESCSTYEGSYTRIFLILLCAISALVFCMCIGEEQAIKRMGGKYWLFETARLLSYFVFPVVAYVFIEIGLYIINGIKANVVFCKNHLKINQNRFGVLNYRINYADIDRIEEYTVSGTSFCCIYFKEPLADTCFSEFKRNSFFSPIGRVLNKRFSSRQKVGITTSTFGKKMYKKILAELLQRMNTFQEAENAEKPSAAA